MFKNALVRWQRVFDREWKLIPDYRNTAFKGGGAGGVIPFSAVTFEVSFLSVIALLNVSVIYHLTAYVANFQNSHIILIWLSWQRY